MTLGVRALLLLAIAVGCGSGVSPPTCEPACRGGSAEPTPSAGCPQGGTCTYLERVAWSYTCTSAAQCTPTGAINTYGTFEACQTWGCMGGNSRCGDQFGAGDAERWSCEACKVSCHDGTLTLCGAARETPQGCSLTDSTWGAYLAECTCR